MNALRQGLPISSLLSLSARHVALTVDSVMEYRLGRLFTAAPSYSESLCSAAGSSVRRCCHSPTRSWRNPLVTAAAQSTSCHHSTIRSHELVSELSSRAYSSRRLSHAVCAAQAAEAEPVLQNQQYDGGRVIKVDTSWHTSLWIFCFDGHAPDA